MNHRRNLEALHAMSPHPHDHLLAPGDLGDEPEHLDQAFEALTPRFASVTWTPGNHELWDRRGTGLRGEARYEALVAVCRRWGVRTPADPPWVYDGAGGRALVVPLFLLYDLSFRPDDVARDAVVAWAAADGIRSTDDRFLHPDPHPTIDAWSDGLLDRAARRLDDAAALGLPLVVTSHFPWRRDLVRFDRVQGGRVKRFVPWCGTRATERWHTRWPISVVVHGHLHMRATDWRDGVRFEEVALGYPRHWDASLGAAHYLREILPGPPATAPTAGPHWHF